MQIYTRERLMQHILEVSDLSTLYRDQPSVYCAKVASWMEDIEETLGKLRHPLAGKVAAERGRIQGVSDGVRDPMVSLEMKRPRQIQRAMAAQSLATIQDLLFHYMEETDLKFRDMEQRMAQLLAVASSVDPIPARSVGETRESWVRRVWSQLCGIQEAKAMVDFLRASLKPYDLNYLLGETLSNLMNNQAEGNTLP